MELNSGVLILSCLAAMMMAVPNGRRDEESNNSVDPAETYFCVYRTVENGRVVAVMALGTVLPEEAAQFDTGRLRLNRARMRGSNQRRGPHGRGSATLMSALCKICRRKNATRCLRRFCSRAPHIRNNGTAPEVRVLVECTRVIFS